MRISVPSLLYAASSIFIIENISIGHQKPPTWMPFIFPTLSYNENLQQSRLYQWPQQLFALTVLLAQLWSHSPCLSSVAICEHHFSSIRDHDYTYFSWEVCSFAFSKQFLQHHTEFEWNPRHCTKMCSSPLCVSSALGWSLFFSVNELEVALLVLISTALMAIYFTVHLREDMRNFQVTVATCCCKK